MSFVLCVHFADMSNEKIWHIALIYALIIGILSEILSKFSKKLEYYFNFC